MRFRTHDDGFRAFITDAQHIEDIEVWVRVDVGAAFVAPVIVHAHIVRYAHGPLHEFAFVVVLALAERVNDFDENFLKDVFRECAVFHKEIDRGVDFSLVTSEKCLEGLFITICVACDQIMIVEHWHNLHEQTDFAVNQLN